MQPRDCWLSSSSVKVWNQILIGEGPRGREPRLYASEAFRLRVGGGCEWRWMPEEAELLHSKSPQIGAPMTDYQAPSADAIHDRAPGDLPEVVACRISRRWTPTRSRPCSKRRRSSRRRAGAINWLGDQQGVKVVDNAVVVPQEFSDAYAQFCSGGWPGIASNPEFGGQGLPKTVALACDEMWAAANVAFALCPELSRAHPRNGSPRHRRVEAGVPRETRVGPVAGTMCLTEPQAARISRR